MRKITTYTFILYFIVLLTLLTIPTSKTGIKLDFYIFGIRSDHYIHALLLLPFLFFCRQLFAKRYAVICWMIGIFFCAFCEALHFFIPYRDFSVSDFYANLIGMSLGLVFYKLPEVDYWLAKRK